MKQKELHKHEKLTKCRVTLFTLQKRLKLDLISVVLKASHNYSPGSDFCCNQVVVTLVNQIFLSENT